MTIAFTIPEQIEKHLQEEAGVNLNAAAKEALAIELYRQAKLSLGQVAEMLDLTVHDADGLLKRHGANPPYTLAEFEQDRAALDESLSG